MTTAAQQTAFVHKIKRLDRAIEVHPIFTKPLWDALWATARAQDWWSDDVGYVGNDKGVHYFQINGHTNGFARLTL